MSSTISAARQALYAALVAASQTNPAIAGVQVVYGPPDQYEEQEVIAMLGVQVPTDSLVVLGPQSGAHQDEVYRLLVALKVYDPQASTSPGSSVTAADVDARAWAMAGAVWDAVVADRTLGGTVMIAHVAAQESEGPQIPVDAGGTRVAGLVVRVDVAVQCMART